MLIDIEGKVINLAQLDNELGGHGLCYDSTRGIYPADSSPISLDEIQDAIENHTAIDPEAERVAARESAIAKLAALGLNESEVAAIVGGV